MEIENLRFKQENGMHQWKAELVRYDLISKSNLFSNSI